MACLRGLLPIVFVLPVALLSGCAALSSVSATAAAGASPEAPPPGHVLLTGDVRSPGTISPEQLAGLPQHTISVEYLSGDGVQQKTETGVLLSDLLPPEVLATTDRKNDLLAFGILAIGSDGYAALVSYGEVSPDFGNRGSCWPRPRTAPRWTGRGWWSPATSGAGATSATSSSCG